MGNNFEIFHSGVGTETYGGCEIIKMRLIFRSSGFRIIVIIIIMTSSSLVAVAVANAAAVATAFIVRNEKVSNQSN